jgi:hypothetical protein
LWQPLLALVVLPQLACGHRPWEDPGEDWELVTSDHFLIRTDADRDDYEPIIQRLEDVYEALRATFFAGIELPRVDVLLFDRPRDFRGLVTGDIAGFFAIRPSAPQGVLVFPVYGEEFDMVASIAAHELAHRFLYARSMRVPSWLHEGFGKYVGAIDVDGDLVVFDAHHIHGGYVYFADPVPLANLFAATSGDLHKNTGLGHYMTAWMLMRQLFGNPRPDTMDRFQKLVERTSAAAGPEAQAQAISEVFDGSSVANIEKEIRAAHSAEYHGMGRPLSRRTFAVTLKRKGRGPLRVERADPRAIKALCRELRPAGARLPSDCGQASGNPAPAAAVSRGVPTGQRCLNSGRTCTLRWRPRLRLPLGAPTFPPGRRGNHEPGSAEKARGVRVLVVGWRDAGPWAS